MTSRSDHPVVRLVADPYPPYQSDMNGTVVGLDHDLVIAAFAAGGRRAETRLLPWTACLTAVRDGAADAIFQITPTPERKAWLSFSCAFRTARTLLYALAGGGPIDASDRRRVGVLEGFQYGPAVEGITGRVELATDADLLAALRAGEIDAAVLDVGVAEHLLEGASDVTPVSGFELRRPLHLAGRHGSEAIVDAFESGLDTLGGPIA